MEQSKQPKKATPEQNANVTEQVKRIVVDRILEEKVQEKLQSPENQLRIEMMAVYKQLTDNTVYTKDTSKHVIDELRKVVDLVSQYRSRVEQVEKENKSINERLAILNKASKGQAERLNTYQIRIEQAERGGFFGEQRKDNTDINRKLDILNKASKGHAERLNKLEKLK